MVYKRVNCKTVVFFANAGDRQYANEKRSGASVKNGEGEWGETLCLLSGSFMHANGR